MMASRMRFLSVVASGLLIAQSPFAQTPPAAPAVAPAVTSALPHAPKLPDLPNGMCPVDPSQDADRNVIPDLHLATQGSYKLLAVFAECTNLKGLRLGTTRVTSLNYYGTVIEQQGVTTPLNRAATLQAASAVIGLTGAYAPEATKPAEDQPTGLGPRRASYQGILKQTPDYLIVGTEQRHLVGTKQFSVAAVSLMTVVNGEIITVNFFAPANDDKNYSALANVADAYASQLLAANP